MVCNNNSCVLSLSTIVLFLSTNVSVLTPIGVALYTTAAGNPGSRTLTAPGSRSSIRGTASRVQTFLDLMSGTPISSVLETRSAGLLPPAPRDDSEDSPNRRIVERRGEYVPNGTLSQFLTFPYVFLTFSSMTLQILTLKLKLASLRTFYQPCDSGVFGCRGMQRPRVLRSSPGHGASLRIYSVRLASLWSLTSPPASRRSLPGA